MKYFLTGATGFVGSHLTKFLRSNGHKVVALVCNQRIPSCRHLALHTALPGSSCPRALTPG
ncbi:MAG: NAD-dependent epimerase/dehydratase family protein [Saprospiraceae bacterium]|nr:NAD-dependent epimerase/dehydratase family protein [Saprospiraceae bacterium]MCF8250126.1 NAD-dependent epimerase/dehydratase family protein [Saprospiraceae bacterium]MCF8279390.1 NAD-dependent epimerase/dehydratase family protein [Bacteroidales bacterium]MCF8311180.1 NAD-dependent epimerase/dehydratase family protein [Saprospiraceae bacterium]MCF8440439.1 NAD-dependent epimerase/dehydratase family protein [Saprospiraceae bacterium]